MPSILLKFTLSLQDISSHHRSARLSWHWRTVTENVANPRQKCPMILNDVIISSHLLQCRTFWIVNLVFSNESSVMSSFYQTSSFVSGNSLKKEKGNSHTFPRGSHYLRFLGQAQWAAASYVFFPEILLQGESISLELSHHSWISPSVNSVHSLPQSLARVTGHLFRHSAGTKVCVAFPCSKGYASSFPPSQGPSICFLFLRKQYQTWVH